MIEVDWQAFPSTALGRRHTCASIIHNSVCLWPFPISKPITLSTIQ